MQFGNKIIIALKHGIEQTRQKHAVAKAKMPHDAEINRYQLPVSPDKDIARMHVGVEITITEHLIKEAGRGIFGQLGDIMTCRLKRGDIIDADAFDPFNNQHARG